MKKYILQYTDRDGTNRYHFSFDENGASWQLTTDPNRASRFYYKNAHEKRLIQKLIEKDKNKWWSMCHTSQLITINEAPHTYFEFLFFFEKIKVRYIHKTFQKTLPSDWVNDILNKHTENVKKWENPNSADAKQYVNRLRLQDLHDIRDENTKDDHCYYYRKYYEWILPRYKGKVNLNEI